MKRIILMAAALVSACSFLAADLTAKSSVKFPKVPNKGRTAIVAHRGFWDCDEAKHSENSIQSLRLAQEYGLWGSECDIQLTSDDVPIVFHNNNVEGVRIWDHPWSSFEAHRLPNGEKIPTLDEYLVQARKSKTTILVIELKKQLNTSREDRLLDLTFEKLHQYGLYNPKRVIFITFSKHMCERIAKEAPKFVNQYLNGELAPAQLRELDINGFDYETTVVKNNPGWTADAHKLGMSVNVWTVNKADEMRWYIDNGVDAITTNDPLLLRRLLGSNEFRKARKFRRD
jgi:glycerophosphoryl diester phosphodiesterase